MNSRRWRQLLGTMTAAAALTFAGNAALAKRLSRQPPRPASTNFHVLRLSAHAAATTPSLPETIDGAARTVFAASFDTGDNVFVATLDNGDVCVVDQEPTVAASMTPSDTSGLTAVGCANASQATRTGTGLAVPSVNGSNARLTLLVPNGVPTVTFRERDGRTTTQAVENNVAQYAASGLTAATFVTAGGQTIHIVVPSLPIGMQSP